MKDHPRLFPIWFLPLVLLILIIFGGPCGCKTGGKWIGGGSSGIKQIITPAELEQQPNGTYKLKPKKTEAPPSKPVVPKAIEVKSAPVPIKSAIIKPELPPETKIEPEKLPPVKAPTIPPLPIKHEEIKIKMNVKPANEDKRAENDPRFATHTKSEPSSANQGSKSESVTVNWLELFMFYFLAIMSLVFAWVLYDIWREYKKAKIVKKAPTKKRAPRKPKKPKKKSS